ncbi:unnamed protein product [Orchesella dallaii]|uniref:Beta-lactamase-related domain-containing protein n=1 Tax=Orchesella dallaii TaxID=48710 RepID=A0ABP1RXV1_9HEXA
MYPFYSQLVKFSIIGIILSISRNSFSQGQNIDPEIQTKIDDFIQNLYLPATKTSTLGLSIVQNDGEVLYSTGFGYADQDKMIPNGNNTQFLIGSTTKSFTAVIVLRVLNEKFPDLGEKVLDTPIKKLIPAANFTFNDRFRSEHVTFRDLLAHRTCILRNDLPLLANPFDTSEEIVYRVRYSEEGCGIRSEFQYNNQMFVVAGELAGLIANSSYDELFQNLLTDLGMLNSSLVKRSDDFSNMPFRAQPYYVIENVSYPINTEMIKRITTSNAAGGLFATANDMGRYMRFLLNLGNIDGKQVVPEDVMKWMTKPAIARAPVIYKTSEEQRLISSTAYGLGLGLANYDGWEYVLHDGYFAPYSTVLSLFPEKKIGVFYSTNQGPLWQDSFVLSTFIYDSLIGVNNASEKAIERLANQQTAFAKKISKKDEVVAKFLKKNKSVGKQNEDIIFGKYGSGSSGDIEIFEKFNNETNSTGIYLSYGRWVQAWMENIGGSTYYLTWDSDIIQDFYATGDLIGAAYATVNNGTLDILLPAGEVLLSMGKFELGVSLDILPTIPWAPDSCGPE